jgi:hypothetical protein
MGIVSLGADATTATLVIDSTPGLKVESHLPQQVPHSCAQESYGQKYASCESDLRPWFNRLVGAGLRIGLDNRFRSKNALIDTGRTHLQFEIPPLTEVCFLRAMRTFSLHPVLGVARLQMHTYRVTLGMLSHLLWDVCTEYSKANIQA